VLQAVEIGVAMGGEFLFFLVAFFSRGDKLAQEKKEREVYGIW